MLVLALPACGSSGDDDDNDVGGPDAASASDADPNAPDALRVECGFDDSEYELLAEVLQLSSAGGGTCVRLTRRNECDGICLAVPFTLLTFRAVHDNASVFVTDTARLHWEESHHNWNDWGEAIDRGLRYRLELTFVDGINDDWTLSAYDTDDARVWGPVELRPFLP